MITQGNRSEGNEKRGSAVTSFFSIFLSCFSCSVPLCMAFLFWGLSHLGFLLLSVFSSMDHALSALYTHALFSSASPAFSSSSFFRLSLFTHVSASAFHSAFHSLCLCLFFFVSVQPARPDSSTAVGKGGPAAAAAGSSAVPRGRKPRCVLCLCYDTTRRCFPHNRQPVLAPLVDSRTSPPFSADLHSSFIPPSRFALSPSLSSAVPSTKAAAKRSNAPQNKADQWQFYTEDSPGIKV